MQRGEIRIVLNSVRHRQIEKEGMREREKERGREGRRKRVSERKGRRKCVCVCVCACVSLLRCDMYVKGGLEKDRHVYNLILTFPKRVDTSSGCLQEHNFHSEQTAKQF